MLAGIAIADQATAQSTLPSGALNQATPTQPHACSDPDIVAQLPSVISQGYRSQNMPDVEVFDVTNVGPDQVSSYFGMLAGNTQGDPFAAAAMQKTGLAIPKCRADVFTSAGDLIVIFWTRMVRGKEYISWEVDDSGTR